MLPDLPLPDLGLSDDEAQARFERLNRKLVPLWKSIETLNPDPQTIVVVPSMTVDYSGAGAVLQAYEERFLFLLLLLRQPRARLVYVTSLAIAPNVIDYYLDLLPGVIKSQARPRLHLVAPLDGSARPLTVKLLERPGLIEHIRALIPDPDRAHLVPYNTTTLERDLALRLGIPMYGADPRFFAFGTKSGARGLFAEEGVPHPFGRSDLRSESDLLEALASLCAERPGTGQAMVKLNEGISGEGNAVVDLAGLPDPASAAAKDALRERLLAMRYELAGTTYESFLAKLEARGGGVEERIAGEEFRSPSVQLRITPLGRVEVLSTHDQVLGGPSGQSYLGYLFPADGAYARAISLVAHKVGLRLAREGVIGRFALDFVAVRSGAGWRVYAIEINLRKGGTTHPFLTLKFLTDGTYDTERAVFTAPSGQEKSFIASDDLDSPHYRAFTADDLFALAVRHDLHFHQTRQTGVVFHMMSALGECGRVGLTAVGDNPAAADAMYARAVAVLDEEAKAALARRDLPPI